MPIQGIDISLNVRNNTNYPQQINVMGNPSNLLDTANATTEYRYDLTAFTITNETNVSIQYKRVGDPSFSLFTFILNGTALQGVIIALNNLGIGYFNLYDELGNTYIGTYNQVYEFGNLEIYANSPSPTTTTTTTTTTIVPTTTTTTTTTTIPIVPTTTTTTTTTIPIVPTTTTTTTTTTIPIVPTTTTTTTTTTIPIVPTTTTTTTTTTIVVISYGIGYNIQIGSTYTGYNTSIDACIAGGSGSTLIVYSTGIINDGEVLYLDAALTQPCQLISGYYWASGGIGIYYSFNYPSGAVANFTYCNLTTTTTTTTTTAAPTTTTTTTTTTAAPTTTTTTTTTTIANFNASVSYATNQYDACNNPLGSVNVVGNDPSFCNCTIFTSAGFITFTNGNYLLSYGGNSININISVAPTSTATMFGGGCSACPLPTTTTTTTTTTIAPTTTTTTTTTTIVSLANINITNGSLDVSISQVVFNFVPATYVSGQPLPNTTGNGTSLNTSQIGTYTLDVYKNNGVAGQHISVTDSVGGIQCIYFGSGSAVESYTNVVYDGVNPIQIDVQDGTCPTTIPLTWEWTNNNVVETPPYGGGYITILVNSIVVVNQLDSSSTTTTIYNGSLTPNIGDVIDVVIYTYPNNTYGTQTLLMVESPLSNILYNANDTQPAAGSPSTLNYSFTATSNVIKITAASNSY